MLCQNGLDFLFLFLFIFLNDKLSDGINKTILVWFFKLIIRLELVHVLLREKN